MITFGWQAPAAYYGCGPVVLYAGSRVTEVVASGSMTILFPVLGAVTIQDEEKQSLINARRGEPVVLRRGRYTITAKAGRVLLLKGERCPTLK